MLASDFNYNLFQELIAQKPVEPRDSSRLMVVDRKNQTVVHRHFFDIIDYLQPGDLLVWNNTKVFKARLFGKLEWSKDPSAPLRSAQGKVEIFLVREMENVGVWKVLAKPGRHLREGMRVKFAPDFYCDALVKETDGTILVQFPDRAEVVREKANKYGHIPVPPYVKNEPEKLETYQTVYARSEGSVAAPTAGFHFTPELIQKLKEKQVEFAEVTLHVGLGTFLPVKSEKVEEHKMHSEWVELNEENAEKINRAKKEGRRVIAVGTTTVRTLEGIAMFSPLAGGIQGGLKQDAAFKPTERPHLASPKRGGLQPYKGDINIFITPVCHDLPSGMSGRPGFRFQVVDALITNFHLPKSTLLMLVCAFAGDREFMLNCYQEAVKEQYRFYSFGDAMLII